MPEKYRRPHTHERVQAVERMRRAWEAERDALRPCAASMQAFGQRLSWVLAQDYCRAHRKASLACDRLRQLRDCGRFRFALKPRDLRLQFALRLRDVRCPRCNGHGRPRIIGLSRYPSI